MGAQPKHRRPMCPKCQDTGHVLRRERNNEVYQEILCLKRCKAARDLEAFHKTRPGWTLTQCAVRRYAKDIR